MDGLVQSRQCLGTKERRCQELVYAWHLDFGLRARQVEDGAGVDDEPSHPSDLHRRKLDAGAFRPQFATEIHLPEEYE